jgi:hypothetical protein
MLEEIGSRRAAAANRRTETFAPFVGCRKGRDLGARANRSRNSPVGRSIRALRLIFDPDSFVTGRGVGLAGYANRRTAAIEAVSDVLCSAFELQLGANEVASASPILFGTHNERERQANETKHD